MKTFCCVLAVVFCFASCTTLDASEQTITIPKMEWSQSNICKGEFEITDTNASYNYYVILRHTDAYAYNNIWVQIGIKAPNDSTFSYQKINMPLGNDANGWYGTGLNDIWESLHKLNPLPASVKAAGKYSFSIEQIMRDNPLSQVLGVGFKVQKAN
jgi:gliding motility-associated lipoprotein GldH